MISMKNLKKKLWNRLLWPLYNFLSFISKILNNTPKKKLSSIRLFGTWEELRIILNNQLGERSEHHFINQSRDFLDKINFKILMSKPFLQSWFDSEMLTNLLIQNKYELDIPDRFKDYRSLRAVGSGIQNTCSIRDWVGFARNELAKRGCILHTFFILPETESVYVSGIKNPSNIDPELIKLRDHFSEKLFISPNRRIFRGVVCDFDTWQENCVVYKGVRQNGYTPKSKYFKNSIRIFGASEVFGTGLADCDTISGKLAPLADKIGFDVVNYGMGGVNFIDIIGRLLKTANNSGDQILLAIPYHTDLKCCDIIIKCGQDDMFDYAHLRPSGAKVVAEKFFEQVSMQNQVNEDSFDDYETSKPKLALDFYFQIIKQIEIKENERAKIKSYINYLLKNKVHSVSGQVNIAGSVAVNCNPITKGHEHLINYARSKVNHLYVLVIEDEHTEVSFRHRFSMVKAVFGEMEGISVLRGGRYVCTEYIAPEYFDKEGNNLENVDFSLESFYFGEYIAPTLGISKIFLGEEPVCKITKQYNRHMAKVMPKYGIELSVIPRIRDAEGDVISASFLRRLIKEKKLEKIEKIMPKAAFDYTLNHDIFN